MLHFHRSHAPRLSKETANTITADGILVWLILKYCDHTAMPFTRPTAAVTGVFRHATSHTVSLTDRNHTRVTQCRTVSSYLFMGPRRRRRRRRRRPGVLAALLPSTDRLAGAISPLLDYCDDGGRAPAQSSPALAHSAH